MEIFKESCDLVGRNYDDVEKTAHVDFAIARTKSKIDDNLAKYAEFREIPVDECKKVCIYGTPDMCVEKVKQYADVGVQSLIWCFQPNKQMEDLQLLSEIIQQFK